MRSDSNSQFYDDPADDPIGEALLSPFGWIAALAAVLAVGTAQFIDVADNRAEWDRSTELKHEQSDQEQAERRAQAAQVMCTSEHGPQSLAVWLSPTTIECVSPRGRRLSRVEGADALR